MATTGTLIKPDGTATLVAAPAAGFSLTALYGLLDCGMVERLGLGKHTCWLDEEGKLARKPVNAVAAALAHRFTTISKADVLVGAVLITPALGSHATGCKVCPEAARLMTPRTGG